MTTFLHFKIIANICVIGYCIYTHEIITAFIWSIATIGWVYLLKKESEVNK